jgi:hypothetical protein
MATHRRDLSGLGNDVVRAKAVRLEGPASPSPKLVQFNARLDFAKLLDQIVAFFGWWQHFYIRADFAGQIDQVFFERRAAIELGVLHGLTPEP